MTQIIRAYTLFSDYDTVYSGKGEPEFWRIILPPYLPSEVICYSAVLVVTTMYSHVVKLTRGPKYDPSPLLETKISFLQMILYTL